MEPGHLPTHVQEAEKDEQPSLAWLLINLPHKNQTLGETTGLPHFLAGREGREQEGKRECLLSLPLPTRTKTCLTTVNAAADIPKNYWLGPEVVLKTAVLKIVSIPGESDLDDAPNLNPQAEA